jgi:hypothetical protein
VNIIHRTMYIYVKYTLYRIQCKVDNVRDTKRDGRRGQPAGNQTRRKLGASAHTSHKAKPRKAKPNQKSQAYTRYDNIRTFRRRPDVRGIARAKNASVPARCCIAIASRSTPKWAIQGHKSSKSCSFLIIVAREHVTQSQGCAGKSSARVRT